MSKSKPRTVAFIQEAGDVKSATDVSEPKPKFGLEPAENAGKKSFAGKQTKRQHSQSCSLSMVSDFIDLDDGSLRSKDDSHKHLYLNKLPYAKNSRKSRMMIKEHKKGGGGGKAIWNKTELEIDDDPFYDSDDDSIDFEERSPTLSADKFDDSVTNWIQEYFENCEVSEVVANLNEINLISELSSRIPYLCIVQALQRKPAQCELTSRLLCELIGENINGEEMIKGFDLVIREMSELTIDCPEAPEIVGKFIARAVADDLLPPKYVQSHKTLIGNDDQIRAFAKAENLLSLDHSYARLDTVWGSTGGERPTKMLISKIRILLAEYLDSDDVIEAERCLRDLEAPHFHHELVFQAILLVLEKSTDFVCNKMISLLESLWKSVVITIDQFEQGINRIYAQMPDIQLDVPAAYILLETFVTLSVTNGTFFSQKLCNKMPKSTRPRFVSEGAACLRRRQVDIN